MRRRHAGAIGLFGQDHFNPLQLADPAVAHQFRHTMIHRQGAILSAGLKDASQFAHCLNENLAFTDRQGRFFALDIFAGAGRHDTNQRVPMIGCGNHDSIHVFAGQDFAKILGSGAIFVVVFGVDHRFGPPHSVAVDIAHDHDPGRFELQISLQIPSRAVVSGSNKPDRDPIAGGFRAKH